MNIHIDEKKEQIIVRLCGELDHHSASTVREQLDQIIDRHPGMNLVLNMKEVSFMDSTGVGMVIGRYRKLKPMGGNIYVSQANPRIEHIFQMSGLNQIIKR